MVKQKPQTPFISGILNYVIKETMCWKATHTTSTSRCRQLTLLGVQVNSQQPKHSPVTPTHPESTQNMQILKL
jgi:hypothetical protein